MALRVGSVHLGVCAAGGSVQGQTGNVGCSQLFSSQPTPHARHSDPLEVLFRVACVCSGPHNIQSSGMYGNTSLFVSECVFVFSSLMLDFF